MAFFSQVAFPTQEPKVVIRGIATSTASVTTCFVSLRIRRCGYRICLDCNRSSTTTVWDDSWPTKIQVPKSSTKVVRAIQMSQDHKCNTPASPHLRCWLFPLRSIHHSFFSNHPLRPHFHLVTFPFAIFVRSSHILLDSVPFGRLRMGEDQTIFVRWRREEERKGAELEESNGAQWDNSNDSRTSQIVTTKDERQ